MPACGYDKTTSAHDPSSEQLDTFVNFNIPCPDDPALALF